MLRQPGQLVQALWSVTQAHSDICFRLSTASVAAQFVPHCTLSRLRICNPITCLPRAFMAKQLAARVTSLDKSKIEDGFHNIEVQ